VVTIARLMPTSKRVKPVVVRGAWLIGDRCFYSIDAGQMGNQTPNRTAPRREVSRPAIMTPAIPPRVRVPANREQQKAATSLPSSCSPRLCRFPGGGTWARSLPAGDGEQAIGQGGFARVAVVILFAAVPAVGAPAELSEVFRQVA